MMGRTIGATNKEQRTPAALALSEAERIELIANIVYEIVMEEAGLCTTG